jgi:rSAM/selenodomain-associated transferase 1
VSGRLIVFAKHPVPGRVKTRMCPPFTPQQAAAFYEEMLRDVLEATAVDAERLGLDAVLYLHPPEACARWREIVPFPVSAQRGADLGVRMEHAFAEQASSGAAPLLLRGSDSPVLGQADLIAAREALVDDDLVLRPGRDGGYDLVGLRAPVAGLFDHPMSTGSVLRDTLANAARLGLRVRLLPEGFDIDTVEDLADLKDARERGLVGRCPRTVRFLDRHDLWWVSD